MSEAKYIPPGQFCSPIALIHSILHQTNGSLFWKELTPKQTLLPFHRARTCIAYSCTALGIPSGSEILVPAYNCGSEIDPLIYMGMTVIMYRVDKQGQVDLDDIVKRITTKTQAIYVTHYFGWPQDTVSLKQVCTDHDLKLIEDCALSIFSQSETTPIASLCDASIYSLPKFLPVPDGGFLILNSDIAQQPNKLPPKPLLVEILKSSLPFLKRWFLSIFGSSVHTSFRKSSEIKNYILHEKDKYSDIPKSYYYDPFRYQRTMSKTTRGLLNLLDFEAIIKSRRQNYLILLNALAKCTLIQPFFDELPVGICPVMLPLIVEERDTMISWLKLQGVPAFPWWSGYHRNLDFSQFPEARYLKDNILCLPIHQDLKNDHLNYMIKCLLEWDRSNQQPL